MAIANGFDMVCKSEIFEPSDSILIQSDCEHALHCIDGKQPVMSLLQRRAMDYILDLATKYHIRVVSKHIRGHQDGGGRNWVNRRCDYLAGLGMRAARNRGVKRLWQDQ